MSSSDTPTREPGGTDPELTALAGALRGLAPRPAALDRDCLLLCARGARSRAAAATLRARGVRRVWSFRGGLAAIDR